MNDTKKEVMFILKTAKGQIDSIIQMLDDNRYCIEISNQILAINSLLKKANFLLLENHLKRCFKEAMQSDSSEDKINEILNLISRLQGR